MSTVSFWFGTDSILPLVGCVAFAIGFAFLCRFTILSLSALRIDPSVVQHSAILITGTSTGFGRRFASDLAEKGFFILAGVRKKEDGERLVEFTSPSARSRVCPLILDVTKKEHIADAVAFVQAKLKEEKRELFALINNAGIHSIGPLELIDENEIRRAFEVNLFGCLAMSRAFLPLLRNFGKSSSSSSSSSSPGSSSMTVKPTSMPKPRIIFISSLAGILGIPYYGSYCLTKSALEAAIDVFRRELALTGVQVSALEPGGFKSNLVDSVPTKLQEWAAMDSLHPYKKSYGRLLVVADKMTPYLPDPKPVVDLVGSVVLSRFPPARVTVGADSMLLSLATYVLPDLVLDFIIRMVATL